MRELERMLGRRTLEAEILHEAISKAQATKQISRPILLPKKVPDEDTSRDELRPEDHIGMVVR
ncbi:UNVERIFIED_ORG: transposase [Rhizobium aethiopicum]